MRVRYLDRSYNRTLTCIICNTLVEIVNKVVVLDDLRLRGDFGLYVLVGAKFLNDWMRAKMEELIADSEPR